MKIKEMAVKIAVWGSVAHSEWDISDALRELHVSHTVDPRDKTKACQIVNVGYPQPKHVHVTTTLKTVMPQAVNFIVASYGALSDTNIPNLPFARERGLEDALKIALRSLQTTSVKVTKLTHVDYINQIAKPSLLNKIQTEILRIQPYSLRKEVQALTLDYFNSKIAKKTIMSFLNRSLRLEKLRNVINLGDDLRAAVSLLSNMDAEAIQIQTGVPSFDIMYLYSAGHPKVKK